MSAGVTKRNETGPATNGPGSVLVVCGPSGAGKSSLVALVKERLDHIFYSVSCTTRRPRPGEQEGVDYHFVSAEEFSRLRDEGAFLEYARVHDFDYGTPRAMVTQWISRGFDVVLDIDVQGAEQVRARMPEAITVLILPPSRDVLEARLRNRGQNEAEDLRRRLHNAGTEVAKYERFDYLIINDDLTAAATALEAIFRAQRQRPSRLNDCAAAIVATFGGVLSDG